MPRILQLSAYAKYTFTRPFQLVVKAKSKFTPKASSPSTIERLLVPINVMIAKLTARNAFVKIVTYILRVFEPNLSNINSQLFFGAWAQVWRLRKLFEDRSTIQK